MEKILLAQFIAHIISDFFAQPEQFSRGKQNQCLGSWHIYAHTLIVFVASFSVTFTFKFIGYAAAIALIHFLIDALKSLGERRLKRKNEIDDDRLYTNRTLFFADQAAHLAAIYCIVVAYWTWNHSTPAYLDTFSINQLLILAGFLLCMKPSNVIIRSCLLSLDLYSTGKNKIEKDQEDLERAGRWIGTIERIMTMVLVMLQQFTAIGFIIAAKSVLRYNDSKTGKTEYVLIGTLLSFGIALLLAVGIREGFFESFLNYISCG